MLSLVTCGGIFVGPMETDVEPHLMGGASHTPDTFNNLNSKVSDAELVALAGQLGGTGASPDVRGIRETSGPTLLTLGSVADGEFIKRSGNNIVGATPPLAAHDLGGAAHNADTLANLNLKISDADVVALAGQLGGTAASPDVRGIRETSGPTLLSVGAVVDGEYVKRVGNALVSGTPPAAPHDLGGAAHNADTLANLNLKISDADVVALAGQLGGTAASPDVRGIRETSGPTLLTFGAIADGDALIRSGANIIGGLSKINAAIAYNTADTLNMVTNSDVDWHAFYVNQGAIASIDGNNDIVLAAGGKYILIGKVWWFSNSNAEVHWQFYRKTAPAGVFGGIVCDYSIGLAYGVPGGSWPLIAYMDASAAAITISLRLINKVSGADPVDAKLGKCAVLIVRIG